MGRTNHIAVWVAAIAMFVLGGAWYTALGAAWLVGIGKTKEQVMAQQPNAAIPMVIAFIVALVITYALAWMLPRLGARSAAGGAATGALIAVTLIASTMAMNYGFEARSILLWLINSGYIVIGVALVGAIVGGWTRKG